VEEKMARPDCGHLGCNNRCTDIEIGHLVQVFAEGRATVMSKALVYDRGGDASTFFKVKLDETKQVVLVAATDLVKLNALEQLGAI
jgi:hypothetical protein